MIAWQNPTEDDLGMDDFIDLGVVSPRAAVRKVVPDQTVHALGDGIGGRLLSITAAALGREGKDWLRQR